MIEHSATESTISECDPDNEISMNTDTNALPCKKNPSSTFDNNQENQTIVSLNYIL